MPRTSQQLYPWHEPVAPRPAATILLLRDSDSGPEVLMTRRSLHARFVPGAYVFPGGAIDAQDHATHAQASRRPTQGDEQLSWAIAAIRESFEELGVLLARHADGSPLTDADLVRLDRGAPLLPQAAVQGLQLDAAQVYPLCRWITDPDIPMRFDVPFLVARMPPGQTPVADQTEQFEPIWIRPADALRRHEAGDFFIIFPTIRTLQRLTDYDSVDAILAACSSEAPLWTSCPRGGLLGGEIVRYMEHEPPYGELQLVCPDGQTLHPLDWQHQHSVALLKNLQRLTAPNPGFMTGPGTNSYIVGDATTGYIVIDPGPDDPAHIQRLFDATRGDIRAIVCTHSHPDHFPGAKPLQALCAGKPPILGLASHPTAEAHSRFTPDRELADDERLQLSGGGATHTLRVIHTPGHAANHLCLLLEEDALLFSGDHILNGSTTLVNPPDGHMGDYLASLDKLDRLCAATGTQFILPAHGYVLGSARRVIAWFRQHRLEREAKVKAAMDALPGGTPEDWVKLAYDDVPPQVWPVALRSVLAHVEHIRELAA